MIAQLASFSGRLTPCPDHGFVERSRVGFNLRSSQQLTSSRRGALSEAGPHRRLAWHTCPQRRQRRSLRVLAAESATASKRSLVRLRRRVCSSSNICLLLRTNSGWLRNCWDSQSSRLVWSPSPLLRYLSISLRPGEGLHATVLERPCQCTCAGRLSAISTDRQVPCAVQHAAGRR